MSWRDEYTTKVLIKYWTDDPFIEKVSIIHKVHASNSKHVLMYNEYKYISPSLDLAWLIPMMNPFD